MYRYLQKQQKYGTGTGYDYECFSLWTVPIALSVIQLSWNLKENTRFKIGNDLVPAWLASVVLFFKVYRILFLYLVNVWMVWCRYQPSAAAVRWASAWRKNIMAPLPSFLTTVDQTSVSDPGPFVRIQIGLFFPASGSRSAKNPDPIWKNTYPDLEKNAQKL